MSPVVIYNPATATSSQMKEERDDKEEVAPATTTRDGSEQLPTT